MNKYELTMILPGKATPAKVKSVQEKIEKALTSIKGKVIKVQELGKIDLSYKIKGNDAGNFLVFDIELDPEGIKILKDKIRVEEEIIRYLIIKKALETKKKKD